VQREGVKERDGLMERLKADVRERDETVRRLKVQLSD